MKFCSACGASVARQIPKGEDRERWVCSACGTIHYENPRMVVGCIIEEGPHLLQARDEQRLRFWRCRRGFSSRRAREGATRYSGGRGVEVIARAHSNRTSGSLPSTGPIARPDGPR